MTNEKKHRFFEIAVEKNDLSDLPHGLNIGFNNGVSMFYNIDQASLIPSHVMEDEDSNLDQEYEKALIKMEQITESLLKKGFSRITFDSYKKAEQDLKNTQQSNFLNAFSPVEKIVYEKTKEFSEEYGLTNASQRNLLSSLRSAIIRGDKINELYLEMYAQDNKKDINRIFDIGVQSLVCNFICELQEKILEKNEVTTVKEKSTKGRKKLKP